MLYLSKTKSALQEKIAKYIGRKYCFLVGRATTGLYLALKALDISSGNIILPSIVCPNPVFSILYSNLTPRFCDINLNDYTIDIASFKKKVDENTKAVIPVNLYGYPADYDELIKICIEKNIKIIEDAAQSFGGTYKGKKMGSFGDISVISFGHTKITDVGLGGAILTDDLVILNKIRAEYEKLKEKPQDIIKKGELYRKVYYTLQSLWEKNDDLYFLYSPFSEIFKSLYLFKFPNDLMNSLENNIKYLDQEVNTRIKNGKLYAELLKDHPKIILPKYHEGNGVYWRFSFIIKGDSQIKITEELRKKGFDVSNWYPSTHKMFIPPGQFIPTEFQNSDFLEKHVFNFWTHSGIEKENIEKICHALLEILK